jgi:succinate dehydrogenase flavin-adding protein (antitoxin of CptAB toxin-antitoxin module)
MLNETEMKRLRWRCTHRAQREIDLLLENFLDKCLSKLSSEQETAFVVLAELEDIELWQLLMGKRECRDPVQRQVLSMLRNVRAV